MKFLVKFRSEAEQAAVDVQSKLIGLRHLEIARESLKVKNLLPEILVGYISSYKENPEVEINEQIASDSQLFENCNVVYIKVDKCSLNSFVVESINRQISDTTGGIVRAWFSYTVDKKQLTEEWIKAEFPLDWRIESIKGVPE